VNVGVDHVLDLGETDIIGIDRERQEKNGKKEFHGLGEDPR
jgi:hypothetical protein